MHASIIAILQSIAHAPEEIRIRAEEVAAYHNARPALRAIAETARQSIPVDVPGHRAAELARTSKLTGIPGRWQSLAIVLNCDITPIHGAMRFSRPARPGSLSYPDDTAGPPDDETPDPPQQAVGETAVHACATAIRG
jgi:hypothetical protein